MILCARRAEQLKVVSDACAEAHKASGVQAGGKFASVLLDVADKQQVSTLFDRVPAELRQVDILGESQVRAPDQAKRLFLQSEQRWFRLGRRANWGYLRCGL